jgi:hypothetical protein
MNQRDCQKIDSKTPFNLWYFSDERYRENAETCKTLIDKIKGIQVYESHLEEAGFVCWFAAFNDILEEKIAYVLHFDVRKEDIYIYFRYVEYVQLEKLRKYNWFIRDKKIYIHYKDYDENEIIQLVSNYVKRIETPFKTGKVKCKKRLPCG